MSPLTVTVQVPYAENEQLFLRQAVEAAKRTFRSLNALPPGNGVEEVSSTRTTQDEPTPWLHLVS